jgi:hypothetical protein
MVFLSMVFSSGTLCAQEHPKIPERPAALKALDGDWVMKGDIRGKSVTHHMVAGPTLQGAFTEIHMKDVETEYEARVLIGYDVDSDSVIVHWIDSFGAKSSIPHGTGSVSDNSVQFTFQYGTGPFRDTFTYNSKTNTWLFVLEASQPDGTWKHFARYDVRAL